MVVLAVSIFTSLQNLGLQQMWIAFGQGTNARWIPVHEIVIALGPQKTSGIRFFHSFTGCDIVSSFYGKGKKSAWHTWDVCGEVSDTFTKLSNLPKEVTHDDLEKLEVCCDP